MSSLIGHVGVGDIVAAEWRHVPSIAGVATLDVIHGASRFEP
ncbi:hypothetical protein ACGFLS_03405 [Streptomyces abikoensis]